MGQYDLTKDEYPNSYEMEIKTITMHPEYRCNKVSHDIAVLELSKSLEWSDRVLPACLPNALGEAGYDRYDNHLAIVAGWGWVNEDSKKGNVTMCEI